MYNKFKVEFDEHIIIKDAIKYTSDSDRFLLYTLAWETDFCHKRLKSLVNLILLILAGSM